MAVLVRKEVGRNKRQRSSGIAHPAGTVAGTAQKGLFRPTSIRVLSALSAGNFSSTHSGPSRSPVRQFFHSSLFTLHPSLFTLLPRPKKQRASPTQIKHNRFLRANKTKNLRTYATKKHLRLSASICGSLFTPSFSLCLFAMSFLCASASLRETFHHKRNLPHFCSSRVATQHKEQHQSKHPATKPLDFRTHPWGPPAISDKSHPQWPYCNAIQGESPPTFALLLHPTQNKKPSRKSAKARRKTSAFICVHPRFLFFLRLSAFV